MFNDKVFSLVEQVILSGTSFFVFILLSVYLSADDWGVLSLGFSLLLFVQGFQRAYVVLPFVTTSLNSEQILRELLTWKLVQIKVLFVCVVFILLIALMFYTFGYQDVSKSFVVSSFLSVVFFTHEFIRRLVIQLKEFVFLLLYSSFFCMFYFVSVSVAIWRGMDPINISITISLLLISFHVVVLLLIFCKFKVRSRVSLSINVVEFGNNASLAHFAFSGYNSMVPLLLTLFSGPAAAGAFAALRNIIQPVQVLINAVDSIDKPKAARELKANGVSAMLEVMKNTIKLLVLIGSIYALLAFFYGEAIFIYIYGDKYSVYAGDYYFWIFISMVMLIVIPLETSVYVLKKLNILILVRVLASVGSIISCVILIPEYGLLGALISMFIGWGVVAVILIGCLRKEWLLYRKG